jgi:flavorubredoxin
MVSFSPFFAKINGMRALVVYDSLYGNTEKIAKATAGAVVGEAKPAY